jgi:hypothetical protein
MNEYIMTFTEEELESIVSCIELTIDDRCIGNEGDDLELIIEKIEKKLESIKKFEGIE